MAIISLLLVLPLWYVLNNAFKVEQEILRQPLAPAAVRRDAGQRGARLQRA